MSTEIIGRALTTSQVAPDGSVVRLGIEDIEGRPAAVILPSSCILQLLMTLPHLISMALKGKFNDESLRLVFPLADWDIEVAAGGQGLILNLKTPDGFAVAFSVDAYTIEQMHCCAEAGCSNAERKLKTLN